MPLKLQSGNTTFARGHVKNRQIPRFQRRGGFVENRSRGRINLETAVASVGAPASDGAKAVHPSALSARQTSGEAVAKNVGQAGGIIGKLRVELADRVSLGFRVDLRISHAAN